MRSPRSVRVPRRSCPWATPALVAKSTPAAPKATGTASRQSACTRDLLGARTDTTGHDKDGAEHPLARDDYANRRTAHPRGARARPPKWPTAAKETTGAQVTHPPPQPVHTAVADPEVGADRQPAVAGPAHGGLLRARPALGRRLLREPDRLPDRLHRGLEHGDRLRPDHPRLPAVHPLEI